MLKILRILLALACLLAALGCAPSPREALIGAWEIVSGSSRAEWEFQENGDFRMEVDGSLFETTFQFVDDDTIRIVAPKDFGGQDATLDFRIQGDQLTLTSQAGDSITFNRVK